MINKNIRFIFNPHLIPTFRGILSSIYVEKNKNITVKSITNVLKNFYRKNFFIKINKHNSPLGTGNVINTNYCHISICQPQDPNKVLILSAIDNLIKGAAGQAVQNMNIIFNFNEQRGLN